MSKKLKDMEFGDLVSLGVELDMTRITAGESLRTCLCEEREEESK